MNSCPTFSSGESEAKVACAQSLFSPWVLGLDNSRPWDETRPVPMAMPNAPAKRISESADPIRSGCTVTAYVENQNPGFPHANRWQSKVHSALGVPRGAANQPRFQWLISGSGSGFPPGEG